MTATRRPNPNTVPIRYRPRVCDRWVELGRVGSAAWAVKLVKKLVATGRGEYEVGTTRFACRRGGCLTVKFSVR